MNTIVWEIAVVLILTLLNGFFVCSEIALISIRKTRVSSLAKRGSNRAKIIQLLQQNPESLFATTQIGVSVITIAASAFAGSSLAGQLSQSLSAAKISFVAHHPYVISFIIVVGVVAYVNLIIGELVPKSLGFRYAEIFALLAAYPIWWLSKISNWLIKLVIGSSKLDTTGMPVA